MIRSPYGVLLFLLFLSPFQAASGQATRPAPAKFRHERLIIPGGPGSNRLVLDATALSGSTSAWQFSRQTTGSDREPMIIASGGMTDFRIYDGVHREVPYLMILPPAPEPKWINGRLSPLAVTKKTSGFQIDLGRPMLVDRVRFDGLPAPFVKRCILEASHDAHEWMRLSGDATVFNLPAEKLESSEIEFLPAEYRYLKITWDDSASARISMPRSAPVRLVSAGALPPRLQVSLQFERRGSEPGASRYRIRLPGPRLPITEIQLSAGGGNILREARITEARLSGNEMVPAVLGTATLRREVRGTLAAAEMSIAVTPPQEAQVDLVIEDGNNPPLDLTGVTAVFAYLPWIYFESADQKPLTARFGYPDLKEPRYDLEAARQSAAKAKTVAARWQDETGAQAEAEAPSNDALPLTGSSIDLGGFRYARSILSGKPGLNSLPLDAAVLAHSRISDLRIAGTDGKQIPYLIEKADEPLSLELPPLEKTQAPRSRAYATGNGPDARSYYRLRLPYPDLPSARLVLTTSTRVFQRRISLHVEKSARAERRDDWMDSIADATWSHTDPETAAPALALRIAPLKTNEVLVVVEEGDNSPLAITSAKLLLPAHRLRFFRGGGDSLKLYYGRNDLDPPRYDLAILAPRLVAAAADDAQLGPETGSSPANAQPISVKLFWGILIAAVVVLLLLISRLLKKAEVT
ncbi:MAG TPA: DUF3999 family protein [Acidobacteriota bacterium]|nr:DUF3999 family protein [Acidobacteriota bacterium]